MKMISGKFMIQNNLLEKNTKFDFLRALEFLVAISFILLALVLGLVFYDKNFAGLLGDPSRDTTSAFIEFPIGISLVWFIFVSFMLIALVTKTKRGNTIMRWCLALIGQNFGQNQAKSYGRIIKSLEYFLIFVTLVIICLSATMWLWRIFWLIKGVI